MYIFILSFIHLRERTSTSRGSSRQRESEADSPLSRESDAGLDPRTVRSCELKEYT